MPTNWDARDMQDQEAYHERSGLGYIHLSMCLMMVNETEITEDNIEQIAKKLYEKRFLKHEGGKGQPATLEQIRHILKPAIGFKIWFS